MHYVLQRALTLTELASIPYFSITNYYIVDIIVFAKFDEIPSLPFQYSPHMHYLCINKIYKALQRALTLIELAPCPYYVLPIKGEVQGFGGGWYCFCCGSHRNRHPRSVLFALYLLNQWVDFDQTGIYALLGREKEVIRSRWPHFQCHTSTLNVKFWLNKVCLQPISWIKWRILAKLSVLQRWDSSKILKYLMILIYFQGHHTIKMSIACTLSPEPICGFWQKKYHCGMGKKWFDFGDRDSYTSWHCTSKY